MNNDLLENLYLKKISKEKLLEKVKKDFNLLPILIDGLNSSKASIRYSCGKILMDLSEKYPEKLYPHMNFFVNVLDSKYRILTWQAMAIIANLVKVDIDNKFEEIFDKYYSFISNEYMVTVANIVGHSGKIAVAKPNLTEKITKQLLKVENLSITPHLTSECKNVIIEKAISSFDVYFPQIKEKNEVILFVKRQLKNSRKTARNNAKEFIEKWKIN